MAIPKKIHQTWKNADIPFDIYKKRWIDSWKKNNPGWEYKLWTDEENRVFIEKNYNWFLKIYDGYPMPIQRADAVRYFLLFHYGGLYVDLDFECLKNIDPLLEGNDLLFGKINDSKNFSDSIPNAFMASSKNNKFWLEIFRELEKNKNAKRVEESTGPAMLTKTIRSYCFKKNIHKADIIESKLLYPVDWTKNGIYANNLSNNIMENPSKEYPDAFAITYWTHNWKDIPAKKNLGKILINKFKSLMASFLS